MNADANRASNNAKVGTETITDSSEVGYCRPPKESRFKPGQSGNPLGRPKGSLSFAAELVEELCQISVVSVNGTAVHTTNKRIVVQKLVAAAKKNPQIAIALINLAAKFDRGQEVDPRAVDDDAFVDKLADRELMGDETAGSPTSPASAAEGEHE
jgi:Family of unknown function (DUF5681)